MSKGYFFYETKCRKCNEVSQYAFPDDANKSPIENWQNMRRYVTASLPDPKIDNCDNCNLTTIQDFISIENKPEE